MEHRTKLLALAHFKNGRTPKEVEELMGITYSKALKLKKALAAAELNDSVKELFDLPETSIEILLHSVEQELTPALEVFGLGELVDEQVVALTDGLSGAKLLNTELQAAAVALTKTISTSAVVATNSETILTLAKALSELNNSFFGSSETSSAQTSGSPGGFEKYLQP